MKLFVYAAFVAAFMFGFLWNGSTAHARSGDPKPEAKKSECPYLNGQASNVCPYSGKKGASQGATKDKKAGECPVTGKKGECPTGAGSGECPYSGEKGKSTSDRPAKKIEVKKV